MERRFEGRRLLGIVGLSICGLVGSVSASAELVPLGPVELKGDVIGDEDLSAVQEMGGYLAIASDETVAFQWLEKRGRGAG